jgi:hypothetical protein
MPLETTPVQQKSNAGGKDFSLFLEINLKDDWKVSKAQSFDKN